MTRTGFHWRHVENSPQLQRIAGALKERPMSTWEITTECETAAASTCVNEIKANPGYSIGRVVRRTSEGGQVHIYVLLAAPGWTPRWRIEGEEIVPVEEKEPAPPREILPGNETARTCRTCGAAIAGSGPPFCDQHRDLFERT